MPTLGVLLIGVVLGAVYVFISARVMSDDDETDPPLAHRSGSSESPFCKPSFMCVRRNDDFILPNFSYEPSSIWNSTKHTPKIPSF